MPTDAPAANSVKLKLNFGLLALALASPGLAQETAEPSLPQASKSFSQLSDQPAPLALQGYPDRPAPLIEWGDRLLGPGNLQRGFTLPTGANWSPAFWVFGNYSTAFQSFDPGSGPRTTEWANRLDLYANLQLSGLERVLVGFRPLDRMAGGQDRFSGYNFEPAHPSRDHGWQGQFSGEPTTAFFEGEIGEIFPKWSHGDKYNMDYGFSIGRQALMLQNGLLVDDDVLDLVGITRNTLLPKGFSVLRVTGLFAWNELDRADNQRDHHAYLFGLDTEGDLFSSTVGATALYVASPNRGDGFYTGIGSSQNFGKLNTVFRIANSVAMEQESSRVRNGTLLFSEMSMSPRGTFNLLYLDAFWGIDHFSSADRGPVAGGPLARAGILNEASDLGRYQAPLSSYPDNAVGANLGYQMFFGGLPRTQLTLEIGARAPTRDPINLQEQPAEGIAARYQKAFGRRVVLTMDVFSVLRENQTAALGPSSQLSFGGRIKVLTKF